MELTRETQPRCPTRPILMEGRSGDGLQGARRLHQLGLFEAVVPGVDYWLSISSWSPSDGGETSPSVLSGRNPVVEPIHS